MIADRKLNQNYTLAIVLIAVGVLIALMNVGVLNWFTTLSFLQLWPVVLIALGVNIWTSGKYPFAVILAALVVAAVLYVSGGSWFNAKATPEQINQGLESASRAVVHLSPSVGSLDLKSKEMTNLLEGTVRTALGEKVSKSFRISNGVAFLDLQSEPRGNRINLFNGRQDRNWDLVISNRVPLELSIDSGVGRNTLDLRNVQLEKLDLSAGVGELVVTLPERGGYKAKLETGVGATTVIIPKSVAVHLTVERGMGAVSVTGTFTQEGNVYTSPDYATAENRAEVMVSGGVGSISIRVGK
jgi:hypothetical protein